MKKPLQTLLMKGDKKRETITYGEKTATVREGDRAYEIGPVVIGCPYLGWCVMRQIKDVQYTRFDTLTADQIRKIIGVISWRPGMREELLDELQNYYPNFEQFSKVTYIEWE